MNSFFLLARCVVKEQLVASRFSIGTTNAVVIVFGSGNGNNESFRKMEIASLGGDAHSAAKKATWKKPCFHGDFFFFAAVCRLHRPCRCTPSLYRIAATTLGSSPVLASSTD